MKQFASFTNDQKSPVTIAIEPWGDDYTLKPGETFDILVNDDQHPWPAVILSENGDVQLYIENVQNRAIAIQVCHKGIVLEGGHNREAAMREG